MSIEQQPTITIGEDYKHPASTFEDRLQDFRGRNREMLFNINGIYEDALDYISRYADLQDEKAIRGELTAQIAESYASQKQSPEESSSFIADRDMFRKMYWAHFEAISMNPVIQDILESDPAKEAYELGYNGGNEKEKYSQEEINENLYGIYKDATQTLLDLDPRLVNKKKLYGTFIDQSLTKANSHEVTFGLLEQNGLGLETPAGKIGLLSFIYLHEKRELYSELMKTIRDFRERSTSKIHSEKVSLAHMKQNTIEEIILNFENSRGYLDLVKEAMEANLEQIPVSGNSPEEQAQNRRKWLNSFHLGLFLRVKAFLPAEAKKVRSHIFELVNNQQFDEVTSYVTNLAKNHPTMYPDFMWRSLGVNIEEVKQEKEQEDIETRNIKQARKEAKKAQDTTERHEKLFAENETLIEQIPAEVFNKTVILPDGTRLTIYEPKLQRKGGLKGSRKEGEKSHAPEIRYIPFRRQDHIGETIGRGTRSAKSILEFLKNGYTIIED